MTEKLLTGMLNLNKTKPNLIGCNFKKYILPSEKSPAQAIKKPNEDSEIKAESPQDNEFINDAFHDNNDIAKSIFYLQRSPQPKLLRNRMRTVK